MSTYEIGLWIYQNGGGDVIQNSIIAQLQERDISAITELNLRNATATNGAIYCDGIRMEELDLFFSYNAGQQTQYQLYLYEALDRYIPIINNYTAFSLTEDKFKTAHLLQRNGIITPEYELCHRNDVHTLRRILKEWGGKIIYKPTEGWGGMGLVKIENDAALDMLIPFIKHTDLRHFYVERFIDYDNTDFRVDIVDGEYISCYGRQAPAGDWKTNITSGGKLLLREPTDELVALAKKAAKLTGLDIAGVDMIYDQEREQYVVLEVNGIPAFATPEQEQLGLDFNTKKINAIVNLIEKKLNEKNK
ncbi:MULTISPECIES: ATP-grasp domain-containing protein [Cycloclasticus]|jgi:ribosomal protein S6--L-glutamate ligase|uniref:Glutathione synthase/Ribosomal protein S6 modification enzyme (Glutaminyl transferase) n=1 Tax=Cycloclasticus zancles 78-ME TaxID=1198232 RepID=S5T984_9GAMM|nr:MULTISPECIES: sugar-transfer associated ATP-grasp domain-containing protein [Cycloclasticus]AGS40276.1 Glutathione synthase/Ribosomal protein S6 modification enzyme (glutaminyl transferase) [Cycloclasticus zancles 78-ME]MBV1898238.1 ATP-grasp domain-containing protein [Cycloclasticus sp.]